MFESLILKQTAKIVETYTLKEIKKNQLSTFNWSELNYETKILFSQLLVTVKFLDLFQAFLNPLTEVCIEKKDVASFHTIFTGRGFILTCT